MTTFDDATAQRTVMNLCVEGGMTPIQTLKQKQSTVRLGMCLNSLFTSCMADLVMGGQTILIVGDRYARIKSKLWPSRTSLKVNFQDSVAVSAGSSKLTAQRVLTADLGLSYVYAI